ncbi:hypothetical protein M9458_045468, partial [Cirrhinus mrigala]
EVEMSAAASEGDSVARRPSAIAAHLSWTLNYQLCSSEPPRRSVWRLDDWFLGRASAALPRPNPVPFFPEVHEELVRTWRVPSSPLATLDGGAAGGYVAVPQVERVITWRDRPHLPSRAAYHAAGQAATCGSTKPG